MDKFARQCARKAAREISHPQRVRAIKGKAPKQGHGSEPNRLLNPAYKAWLASDRSAFAPPATVANPRAGKVRELVVSNNDKRCHRNRPHAPVSA